MTESKSLSDGERLERLEELLNKSTDSQVPFSTAVVHVFDISCPEMEMYLVLLDYPESTPNELADLLDLTRRLMSKRLNSLCEKGMATRKERIDNKAGVRYEYTAQPLDETIDWMTDEIDNWSADVGEQLATFRMEWPDHDDQELESV